MKTIFTILFCLGLVLHSFSQPLTCTVTCGCTSCYGVADAVGAVKAAGGTAPYTYAWTPMGGNADTAKNLTAGSYTVLVADANSNTCTGTCTVCQPSAVTNTVTPTAASCSTCNDGIANAGPSGGSPPYTYSWSNGQSMQTATGLSPGTYTVDVIDSHGCNHTTTVTINSANGIYEENNNNAIQLFPNPCNGVFMIQSGFGQLINGKIEIVNVLGDKIFSYTIDSNRSSIDISTQSNGIYFLQLKTENGISNKKIIINK
jgi:hypothetical protein